MARMRSSYFLLIAARAKKRTPGCVLDVGSWWSLSGRECMDWSDFQKTGWWSSSWWGKIKWVCSLKVKYLNIEDKLSYRIDSFWSLVCGSFIKGEFLQVQKFETESKYCDISLSYFCFAHLCYDGVVVFQSSLFYVYCRGKVLFIFGLVRRGGHLS